MSEQVEGQLTLFPADSPASHSPLPGSNEARRMTAISGQKWLGLSRNSGPLGSLEKMLLESSEWHSPIFYLNWKPVDIGQGHFLFQLALSEPDTGDTESRLWATPNTMDYLPQRSPEALKRQANGSRKGRKRPANLREQVNPETMNMWPTPTQNGNYNRPGISKTSGMGLATAVKLWPTPKASLRGDCPSERNRRSPDLSSAVKMYNTPTAQDAKNSTLPKSQIKRDSLVGDVMREKALFPTPTTGGCAAGAGCGMEKTAYEVVSIVEKWSAEHSIKTRQSEFLKMFPDATLDYNGISMIGPCQIEANLRNSEMCKKMTSCTECRKAYWSEEVE